MINPPTRRSFEGALRHGTLKGLVDDFRAQGLSQVAIYVLFADFTATLRGEGREADAEAVEVGAMDFIWGWCPKGKEWFDHTLTDQEVRAYRQAHQGESGASEPGAVS
jgi:hypothetical protein